MNKPVTHNRATRILECYGSQPESWPASEKAATLFLVNSYPDLQSLQEDAAVVDEVLNTDRNMYDMATHKIDYDALADKIMNSLPQQENSQPVVSSGKGRPWKYSLVASVAISAIAALLYLSQPHLPGSNKGGGNEFDQWAWSQFFTEETQEQDTSVIASAFPVISLAEPSLLE